MGRPAKAAAPKDAGKPAETKAAKKPEETKAAVELAAADGVLALQRFKVLEAEVASAGRSIRPTGSLVGLDVVTGDGLVSLRRVQAEGKAPMDAHSWRNGAQPNENDVMGQ